MATAAMPTRRANPTAHARRRFGPRWFVPFKRKKGCDTTPEQKRLNRVLAALRSAVEHPFRVLKRQFGYVKVRIGACSRTHSTCSASLPW